MTRYSSGIFARPCPDILLISNSRFTLRNINRSVLTAGPLAILAIRRTPMLKIVKIGVAQFQS
jgi:hypothetical protein